MGLEKKGNFLEKEFFLEEHLLKGRFRNFYAKSDNGNFLSTPKVVFYNKLINFWISKNDKFFTKNFL